jgi:SET domain-containing protein
MYRPLPNQLTIKNSEIEGLGLFSEIKISKNSFIGVTHIRNESFPNSYIRTPLGGFYNHSKNPNIIKLGTDILPEFEFGKIINSNFISSINKKDQKKSNYLFLVSLKDIDPGQELVAEYTFYQF